MEAILNDNNSGVVLDVMRCEALFALLHSLITTTMYAVLEQNIVKYRKNVKIPSCVVTMRSFQIGLGDFVPGTGTQLEKDADVDELQANQMKLYVSFLYLLGQYLTNRLRRCSKDLPKTNVFFTS